MRYSLVNTQAGVVENVLEIFEGDSTQAPDGFLLLQSDTGSIGDAWDGTNVVPSAPSTPLTLAQTLKLGDLYTLYATKYAKGVNYNSKNFQIDPASLQNINGASSMALVAQITSGPWPSNFVWIASDNSQMPVSTTTDMISFGVAVGQYVTALVMTNFALKQAIRTATTAAAVDAIDITQGWPTNTP